MLIENQFPARLQEGVQLVRNFFRLWHWTQDRDANDGIHALGLDTIFLELCHILNPTWNDSVDIVELSFLNAGS